MIGAGKGGRKAGWAGGADGAVLGLLLAGGMAWCAAEALGRRSALGEAWTPPEPSRMLHRVDLRTAGEAELRLLPGVGPRLAGRIEAERAAGGPFASLADVERRVPGVGPARVGWWRDRVAGLPEEAR